MAFSISRYVDPGVYIQEVTGPGSISVTSERILALVGVAPRTRRTVNEEVVRGRIFAEEITLASSTPYIGTLSQVSDRSRNDATLYMNGNELGLGDWSFNSAALVGADTGGTVDTSTLVSFTLEVDHIKPLTVTLTSGLTTPIATIAADINAALLADGDYGTAYASVATVASDILTLTSPLTTPESSVRVYLSLANDAASAISALAWAPTASAGVQADTAITVVDRAYNAAATYTLDYNAIDIVVDALSNATTSTPLSDVTGVGAYPGGLDYVEDVDYQETGNTVDWVLPAQAQVLSQDLVASPPTIVASTNDKLSIEVNELGPVIVTLTPGAPTALATLALDINTALNNATAYGPAYAHVCSVVGNYLQFDAPSPFANYPLDVGSASLISFASTSDDAFATLFGTGVSQTYETRGVGARPAFGTSYFATYDYTRPSTDYTTAHRVYDVDQLWAYTTQLTLSNYLRNALCVAGEIAFENGASSLYLIQANDQTVEGFPTQTQINTAIDVAEEYALITEVLTLDTALETTVYQMRHVSDQSSLLEKHYRRGWFGMARGTSVGDPDTPDTFVFRSTKTLQPGNTSSGRGRLMLIAPANATRTLTLDTGREVDVDLDGTYIATAVASLSTSLNSPSDVLINKTIAGFHIDGFGTYLRGERHTLADNGVMVVTLDPDAGNFTLIDPTTTENGGSKVIQFSEPSASPQKDAVTLTVDRLLDSNVKGLVPDDLSDFISEIKKWIVLGILANINNGTIGPYRDNSGVTRDIDATTDIQVYQSSTDPRVFYFKYWYNLRYPAKWFFGEYSVDNPFFGPQ